MLKLEVVAPGNMNAIVYWFDLHLDDVETLSNGVFVVLCHGTLWVPTPGKEVSGRFQR